MTGRDAHKIVISPVGDFDGALLHAVSGEVTRVFGFPAENLVLLTEIRFAFDPGREQYHSTPILAELSRMAPDHALKVLCITQEDLFIPILTHVYGEAQMGGRSCIVSTFRLKEGISRLRAREAFIARVAKEAVHELGHTFRLRHCKDPACIMHYCRSQDDVDRKSDQLCRYCRVLLEDEMGRLER